MWCGFTSHTVLGHMLQIKVGCDGANQLYSWQCYLLAKMYLTFNRNNTSKSILDPATSKKYTGYGNCVCLNIVSPLEVLSNSIDMLFFWGVTYKWANWHHLPLTDLISDRYEYIIYRNVQLKNALSYLLSLFILSFFLSSHVYSSSSLTAFVLSYGRKERQNLVTQEQKSAR
jgi:hypothetical protein